MKDKLILSLDCESESALNLVDYFLNYFNFYKIGLPLILGTEWLDIIYYLKSKNKLVMLDINIFANAHVLKKTLETIKKLPVDYVTINLLGGGDMVKIAKDILDDEIELIGNTLHTSYTTTCVKQTLFAKCNISDQVERLVRLAVNNGASGVICSSQDNEKIKKHDTTIFNTGIRYKYPYIDHSRVSTPLKAFDEGADFIILGREIYNNENPFLRYQEILKNLQKT